MSDLRLIGYEYSVYAWCARLACVEKGVAFDWVEMSPFTPEGLTDVRQEHPFGRVPILKRGDFRLYETAAILTYLDAGFDGPELRPTDAQVLARMVQVMGIVDSYAYRPMVRQAFSNAVFLPLAGVEADPDELAAGLAKSARVLGALEDIAAEGLVLNGDAVTLADCMLAPMMGYFTKVADGAELLSLHPALARWFDTMSQRESYRRTEPDLHKLATET